MTLNKTWLVFALVATVAMATEPAAAQTIRFGVDENGQISQSDRGVAAPIAGEIVPGDSYFAYTADNTTCNGDGTMAISSDATWVQLEGDIQTSDNNDARDGGAGETIIRGPTPEASGSGAWNSGFTWTLEADDTGFETIRGRDGSTLGDPLIYQVTANFDCSGATAGDPPVITYSAFHRGTASQSVPTLSTWGIGLLVLLVVGLTLVRLRD